MKLSKIIFAICGFLLAAMSTSCLSRLQTTGMANGWYDVKNPEQNLVGSKPIVRASDFTNLHLDSAKIQGSGQTIYTITGNVTDKEQWEKAPKRPSAHTSASSTTTVWYVPHASTVPSKMEDS